MMIFSPNLGYAYYNAFPFLRSMYDVLGYTRYWNTLKSNAIDRSYDEYMIRGNQRALDDWQRNVGNRTGRSIRYPELSYAGAIAGYRAGIGRSYLSDDTAYSTFAGSLPYRGAGLYGIGGRLFRNL